jgi:hypothetical protein
MKGRIESGHLCTVAPVDCSTLSVGDIVLCKEHGAEYLRMRLADNDFKSAIIAVESTDGSGRMASLENAFVSSHKPERKLKSALKRIAS